MLWSVETLTGWSLQATDGEIGKTVDFYFDDRTWTIRYLVVRTGSWFFGRQVLISPEALEDPHPEEEHLPVHITRDQVKHSPDIDLARPVSRQKTIELNQYYGWRSPTWYFAGISQFQPPPIPPGAPQGLQPEEGDPHLRSAGEVKGYHLLATDGSLGHVEDFLVDDRDWCLGYLVADTGKVLPGKKVLLLPRCIAKVVWSERRVHIDLTRDQIREGPEYRGHPPKEEELERLHACYHWPRTFGAPEKE